MIRALLALIVLCLALSAPAGAQFTTGQTQTTQEQAATDAEIQQLIRILEDDAARTRLIETLRAAVEADPDPVAEPTLAQQLAEHTRGVVETIAALVTAAFALVSQLMDVFTGAVEIDPNILLGLVPQVVVVIAATFGVYLLLRMLAPRVYRSLADVAARTSIVRRLAIILAAVAVDLATVAIAWGLGHAVAVNVGRDWRMGINQTLFLNAFLIVELSKVAMRAALAPNWPALRPVRMDDTTAAYWYFWLSRLISIVGYTILFIAPILDANVSRASGEAVRIIVLLAALVMACSIILQNRGQLRGFLLQRALARPGTTVGQVLLVLANIWHVVAIFYLIVIFVLWLVDHEAALPFVLWSTAQSIVAILVGIILSSVITRVASGGMHLPDDVKQRLPLLEARLNAFVPNVLFVVRLIILVGVLVAVAQAWHLADFASWVTSEIGQRLLSTIISLLLVLGLAAGVYLAVQSWIEYRLNPNYGTVPTARERTLLSLFRNAFTVVLAVLVAMLVLSELGVNIGPLLAGAGVVGLAIGFGAQKLVQDIISGVFIQFENAMNEGDVVTAGGITGVVEKLTIRSVSIRTLDGGYHVVPFSSVDAVSNFMKHFSYHVASIGVAYREKVPEVKQAMLEAFEKLKETEHFEHVIGDIEMHGVTEFGDSAVMVRARIKTAPGQQWALGRAYNEIIKEIFDARDIEIPYPHMTIYMGADKQGAAPPLHVLQDAEALPAPAPASAPRAGARPRKAATSQKAPAARKRRKKDKAQEADITSSEMPGEGEV